MGMTLWHLVQDDAASRASWIGEDYALAGIGWGTRQ